MMIVIGAEYKHYKGGLYCVTGVGTHTETDDKLVIYSPVEDGKPDFSIIYCRPYNMFVDEWEYAGDKIKRFSPTGIIHLVR